MYFKNREQAGIVLANAIYNEWKYKNAVVVALSLTGVPVAKAIAKKLRASLEMIAVSKIGTPLNPNYEIGAVGDSYQIWLNNELINFLNINQFQLDKTIARSMMEVQNIERIFQLKLNPMDVRDRSVILVDDGISSGASMLVALRSLRIQGAKEITVVVPVASPTGYQLVKSEADYLFSAHTPSIFGSVGEWYEEYPTLEVDLIKRELKNFSFNEVSIEVFGKKIVGELVKPKKISGWVIFVHGKGSCRKNIKNLKIAKSLNENGYGTLVFDLFTEDEINSNSNYYHVDVISQRLSMITQWLKNNVVFDQLPIAFFGSGSGVAAILHCVSLFEPLTQGMVSLNGKPDLLIPLQKIKCPTLFIIESDHSELIFSNRIAIDLMPESNAKLMVGNIDHLVNESLVWMKSSFSHENRYEESSYPNY